MKLYFENKKKNYSELKLESMREYDLNRYQDVLNRCELEIEELNRLGLAVELRPIAEYKDNYEPCLAILRSTSLNSEELADVAMLLKAISRKIQR